MELEEKNEGTEKDSKNQEKWINNSIQDMKKNSEDSKEIRDQRKNN